MRANAFFHQDELVLFIDQDEVFYINNTEYNSFAIWYNSPVQLILLPVVGYFEVVASDGIVATAFNGEPASAI